MTAVPQPTSEEATPPTVFVVEDDVSVREAIEGLVRTAGWNVEVFASARAFLARPEFCGPRCIILDMTLPDVNGLELQKNLAGNDELPIIFVTGYGSIPLSVQAMKAGAFEFLSKPCDSNVLLAAIEAAIRFSRAAVARNMLAQPRELLYASLTVREREVMAEVVAGCLNKQIAAKLGIAEITVKAHRGQVMRKMKTDSVAALVKLDALLRHAAT